MLNIVIGIGGLVVGGLYYGFLPGGDRIDWYKAPIRSPAMDRLAVVAGVVFSILLVTGLVRVLS